MQLRVVCALMLSLLVVSCSGKRRADRGFDPPRVEHDEAANPINPESRSYQPRRGPIYTASDKALRAMGGGGAGGARTLPSEVFFDGRPNAK